MQIGPKILSSEEKLILQTRLLEVADQAILAVDLDGQIVYANRFAEKFFDWTLNEVQGRDITGVLDSPLLMEAIGANFEQLQHGQSWSGEFRIQGQDRTSFMTRINASLIQIQQQTLVGIVVTRSNDPDWQQLQEANRLIAEVDALLVDTVDYETTLNAFAQLAVPQLADWCAIHLYKPDGSLEPAAIAPIETKKLQESQDWINHYLQMDDTNGLPAVLRSGEAKLVDEANLNQWSTAAAIQSYMIVPLLARTKILGTVTFVAVEPGRYFDRSVLALVENLSSHIAIYLEKASLYEESQRLNTELEQRVNKRTAQLRSAIEQLKQSEEMNQMLFRISKKLNSTLDVDKILDALAQEAIRLVNGESGFAGLRTAEGMTVHKYFHRGTAIPFDYTWSIREGIPGWVLEHKVPYGTSDAQSDPLMHHHLSINTDVNSVICTPILDSAGEVLGYFDIRDKQGSDGFTISDQEMLMALAPVASIAIQNALAYQQRLANVSELKETSSQLEALNANIESAREEERNQIARELHDLLGQALTAMKFDLAWLAERLGKKDSTLAQKAESVKMQVDGMIKTVRRISTELRPAMLDDLGLAASLEWQARDFEKRTGIRCYVKVSVPAENLSLTRTQSVALFRVFQEALTNVARHANAKHIEVKLFATPEDLTLRIHDDGRGIQAREISSRQSLGLLGMRERVKALDGSFDIQGAQGGGTIVTVSIPLNNADDVI
jgi:PAS domain S-box-containing protein